jgi:very-long-chain (3R)-3-hydroxyacyl-CoA dehydratase
MNSWSYGLLNILLYIGKRGHYKDVWPHVQYSVSLFQSLQLLEVIHCVVGLVPSNAIQTLIQISSRLIVVWGILLPVVESRNSIGVPMLLICWSIAEMTRYLYYALNIYEMVPYLLTWLRYTLFIVLYPIGVSGELITMVSAFPYIRDRQLFAYPLPNFANISFYYHYMIVLIMLSYIPCMFSHKLLFIFENINDLINEYSFISSFSSIVLLYD